MASLSSAAPTACSTHQSPSSSCGNGYNGWYLDANRGHGICNIRSVANCNHICNAVSGCNFFSTSTTYSCYACFIYQSCPSRIGAAANVGSVAGDYTVYVGDRIHSPLYSRLFVAPPSSWGGTQSYCAANGGSLVSIHSEVENAIVHGWLASHTTSTYPWIGGSTSTCAAGCGGASQRLAQYTWTDGTVPPPATPCAPVQLPPLPPLTNAPPACARDAANELHARRQLERRRAKCHTLL